MGCATIRHTTMIGVYRVYLITLATPATYIRPTGTNPRGEYCLLENRQPPLADAALIRIHCTRSGNPPGCGGGLLIWHVDSAQIANTRFHAPPPLTNTVNFRALHGVVVEEADGLRQLWC